MMPPDLLLGLTRRYCESHRRYHAIEHVARMLWVGREFELSDVQVAAIWYHDAVYHVPSDTNEEDSAELARAELRAGGWSEKRAEQVARIVLDTEHHRPSTPESSIVIDLDLEPLAADAKRYARNARLIREEYACIPDDEFRQGHRRVLRSFLDRDQIYWTPWGKTLEPDARANLERALADLGD